MKKLICAVTTTIAFLLLCATAPAQIDFSITDVVANPGDNVSVAITASTAGPDILLAGFNLPIDVGGDGLGLPVGLSVVGGTSIFPGPMTSGNFLGGATGTADNVANGSDLTFAGLTIGSAPTEIFEIEFLVDGGVAPGTTFDLTLLNEAPIAAIDTNALPIEIGLLNPGSITVVAAVPEPSSGMILVGIACLGALRRRRTR